jgi:hypothetical protein
MVAYQDNCMPYSYLMMLIIKIIGSYNLWFEVKGIMMYVVKESTGHIL